MLFGFMPKYGSESFLSAACKKRPGCNPLWMRALVPDPTRCLPRPSNSNNMWTVVAPSFGDVSAHGVVHRFTSSAYGDGSWATPCERSTRCGFGVVQVLIRRGFTRVISCLLGPFPAPIQSTPAAEAYALLQYVANLVDKPGMIFFPECPWVASSFLSGRASGAFSTNASIPSVS